MVFFEGAFAFGVVLSHKVIILLFGAASQVRFVGIQLLFLKVFRAGVFLNRLLFTCHAQKHCLLLQSIQINVVDVSRRKRTRKQIVDVLLSPAANEGLVEDVNNAGPFLRFSSKHRSDEISELFGVSGHDGRKSTF